MPAKLRLLSPAGAAYISLIKLGVIVVPEVLCALAEGIAEFDIIVSIEIKSKLLTITAITFLFPNLSL